MLRRIIARLPTYAADARQDPEWLLMFAFGRILAVRHFLWRRGSRKPTARPDDVNSLFSTPKEAALLDLRTNGIHTGFTLPPSIVAEIRTFAEGRVCYANFDPDRPFLPAEHREAERIFGKAILTGHYLDTVEECPAVERIRSDATVLSVAEEYLGDSPMPISTRLWWSFPTQKASEQDLHHASQDKMHFDLDDWRALKFFFYITNVGPADGPHVYMRGTHRRRKLRHQFTPVVGHGTSKVLAAYGPENAMTLVGGAGFGFAEDPFAFHMGQVPRGQPRLVLEIGFGVSTGPRRRFHGHLVLH